MIKHHKKIRNYLWGSDVVEWDEEVLDKEICDHFWEYTKDEKQRTCAKCQLKQQYNPRSRTTGVTPVAGYPRFITEYGYWFNIKK